jgi:hypothetical protein
MAANRPDVKTISNKSALPEPPAGQDYSFKPAATLDQARGVCARNGATQGWWLKNRVYFIQETACLQLKPICLCIEFIGDNPSCPSHGKEAKA